MQLFIEFASVTVEDERKEKKPAFMRKENRDKDKSAKRARISSSRSPSPASKISVSDEEVPFIDWRTDQKLRQNCIVVINKSDKKWAYMAMTQQGYDFKPIEPSQTSSSAQDPFKAPTTFPFFKDIGEVKNEPDDGDFDASSFVSSALKNLEPSDDSPSRTIAPQPITKDSRSISERSSVPLMIDTSFSSDFGSKSDLTSDITIKPEPRSPKNTAQNGLDPPFELTNKKPVEDDDDSDRETVPGNECPNERLKQLENMSHEEADSAEFKRDEPPELPPILDLNDLTDPLERSPPYMKD